MNEKSTTYRNLPEDPCLTEAQLYGYIDGKLTPQEQHVVEKHVLDCDMCSDALDGLALVKNREKAAFVPSVTDQQPATEKETKPADEKGGRIIPLFGARGRYAAAAAIILLLGFAWFLRDNFLSADKEKSLSQNADSSASPTVFEAAGAKMDSISPAARGEDKPLDEAPGEAANDKAPAPPAPALKTGEAGNGPVAGLDQNDDAAKNASPKAIDGDMESPKLADEKQDAVMEQDVVTTSKTDNKEGVAPAGSGWYKNNADGQKSNNQQVLEDKTKNFGLLNVKQETAKKKSRFNLDTQFKKERSAAYGFSSPRADAPSDFLSKSSISDTTQPALGTTVNSKDQLSGGTYSVTVTDANGCCNTGTTTVTAPVLSNAATTTSGSTVTLSPNASGAASYTWSGGNYASGTAPAHNNIPLSIVAADSIKVRNQLESEEYDRKTPVADNQPADAVQYKRGMDLLKANNDQAAIVAFDAILLNPKSAYFEDAQWYKAVALVRLNKKEEAKVLLNAIVKKGGKFKALAESQLKQF